MIRGIGGIFLYADDAPALVDWYTRHFGLAFEFEPEESSYYRNFVLPQDPAYGKTEHEVFAIRQAKSRRQDKSCRLVMNLRVEGLTALLDHLEKSGVSVDRQQDYEYGRFAWLTAPEGHLIELFEPT